MFFHAIPLFFRVFLHIRKTFIMLIRHLENKRAFFFIDSVVLRVSDESIFFMFSSYLFFCDFKFFLLPNTIIFFLYTIGLLRCLASPDSIFFSSSIDCFIGFVVGIGFLYFFAKIYQIIRKKEGMGMGDVKLLGALGLWLGWQSLFFIIIVSALLGILVGLSAVALGKIKIQNKIPYGCFLIIATILYMAFISSITSFYQTYMFV